jgi:xanthine dehydrogenase accessory factor
MDDIFEAIVRMRREGKRGALATIVSVRGSVPSQHAAKMLFHEDGSTVGTVGGGCVEAEVWQAAREVMESDKPRTLSFNLNQNPRYDTGLVCGGSLDVFVEPVAPPARVYVFGAGHVGHSVYRAARLAGFEVVVIDDRDTFACRERFPDAHEIHAGELDQVTPSLAPSAGSSIVIATRGHRDDMGVLRWAVTTPARYIGMLGSRRKVLTIYRELEADGVSPDALARVRAPIGIDIGSATPEEIAISIVAELIAHRRGAELGQSRLPRLPRRPDVAPQPIPRGEEAAAGA